VLSVDPDDSYFESYSHGLLLDWGRTVVGAKFRDLWCFFEGFGVGAFSFNAGWSEGCSLRGLFGLLPDNHHDLIIPLLPLLIALVVLHVPQHIIPALAVVEVFLAFYHPRHSRFLQSVFHLVNLEHIPCHPIPLRPVVLHSRQALAEVQGKDRAEGFWPGVHDRVCAEYGGPCLVEIAESLHEESLFFMQVLLQGLQGLGWRLFLKLHPRLPHPIRINFLQLTPDQHRVLLKLIRKLIACLSL
jgi:hypothetical protein